jgi:HEAT repeat protein
VTYRVVVPENTPRARIEAETAMRGQEAFVAGCLDLLLGTGEDPELLTCLGGPGAAKFLDGRCHDDTYWLRVWALRGLLWSWDSSATGSVQEALHDDSWRVREMAAKVVARHLVDDAFTGVADLRGDPVARVRAAADRALVRLSEAGA